MIEIKNLTKTYGKVLANDNLNIAFPAGKLTVLLGPNGAGKSTMIKSICGMHTPNSGTIAINGLDHNDLAAKFMLSYSPEVPVLYDYLTLEEHLRFITKGYGKKFDETRAIHLLEKFEMLPFRNKIVKDFSKGQKQKVSILMAIILDTPVIVLDEPFSGLDPESVAFFKNLLKELTNEGKTVLLSTHLLDVAQTIADHYCIIRQGKVVKQADQGVDISMVYMESKV